jgi:hypothetical protein
MRIVFVGFRSAAFRNAESFSNSRAPISTTMRIMSGQIFLPMLMSSVRSKYLRAPYREVLPSLLGSHRCG